MTEAPKASNELTRSVKDWLEWALPYIRIAGASYARTPYWVDTKTHTLFQRKVAVQRCEDSRSAFAAAEWYITRDWAERLAEHYFVCHAAAVERHGRALLLVGDHGSGKSTLALSLVGREFSYLSDEFAVICGDTLSVLPFPNALCIKTPAGVRMRALNCCFEGVPYPPDFGRRDRNALCCVPRKEIVPPAGSRFPIHDIAFLHDQQYPLRPSPVPQWKSVLALYGASRVLGDARFHIAADVVRRARTWELGRSDVERTADSIEAVLTDEY